MKQGWELQKSMIRQLDINRINEDSSQKVCVGPSAVVCSEAARRILKVIVDKVNGSWWDTMHTQIKIATLYEKVFVNHLPITREEMKDLRDFFLRGDVPEIWNQILSKLSIQQTDDNKKFIRGFLEDKDGKYNSKTLIHYVLQELEAYPSVVDIDLLEWETMVSLNEIEWVGEWYSYKNISGKYKSFLIKKDGEIVYFKENFEQVPWVLDNGLVFWEEWLRKPDTEGPSQTGVLYRFNPETKQLEQVYAKEGLSAVGTYALSNEYSFFQTAGISWKKWLIKAREAKTGESPAAWEISEILPELYDRVYIWPHGFVITERPENEDDENNKNTVVWIHVESYDFGDKLTGKCIFWELAQRDRDHPDKNLVKFHDDKNICGVFTTEWYDYYTVNAENQTITPIEWLQWTDKFHNCFFEGVFPVWIRENWKLFLKIFDKETNTAKDLLETQQDGRYIGGIPEWHPPSTPVLRIWNTYFYFYEWKLYGLKKGFGIPNLSGGIYEKNLLFNWHSEWVSIYDDFDTVSPYLQEFQTPAVVKI